MLADDARGGWTNRYTTEFAHRYKDSANHKRGWLTGLLWSSEPADLRVVAREAAAAVCRFARIQVRGYPVTLEECMQQSGLVATQAGSDAPMYDDDELHYTREVLAPFAQSTRPADVIPCLFGDRAAAELGYPPLGLSPRAGLALAAHEAQM